MQVSFCPSYTRNSSRDNALTMMMSGFSCASGGFQLVSESVQEQLEQVDKMTLARPQLLVYCLFFFYCPTSELVE